MAAHEVSTPAATSADIIDRILGRDRKMIDLATRLGSISDGNRLQDLTMRQLLVLSLLSGHARPVSEIAGAIGITVSSASTLVDRIARSRLIVRERSSTDRRVVICRLTDEGHEALRDCLDMGRVNLARLLEGMSRDELLTIETSFDLLIHAAESVLGGTGPASSAEAAIGRDR